MSDKIKKVRLAKEMEDPFYLKDPKLLELYKKSCPPLESYYYFPKGEEIIIHNYKKPIKSLRRVFYNVPYTNDEQKWLIEFKQLLNLHSDLKLPDYFYDYFLLAFIYSEPDDLNKSYQRVKEYIQFCERTFPILITPKSKLIEILNKGFIYVYGRDNRFRPIIICQSKVFQKFYKNYQTEELLQASSFLCQYIINNMIIPGQFETWNMIINLRGVSILSLPEPLKKLIPELSNYFLSRLYKNYLIGLNFITRILYKIAVNFIDKVTAAKIIVLEKNKDPALFKEIREDNIEEQFGGTAPNMPIENQNGFFPPRMPSNHFIKDNENKSDILISEDEYINRYKNGKIPEACLSPYIYDKLLNEKNNKYKNTSEKLEEKNCDENLEQINQNSTKKTDEKIILKKEQSIFIQSNLLKKNSEIIKMKQFMYDGWKYKEEFNFSKYSSNCYSSQNINILSEINKFTQEKIKYFSKITLFNK